MVTEVWDFDTHRGPDQQVHQGVVRLLDGASVSIDLRHLIGNK
eukprot:SAG31_NODE_275_length_18666_cov_8.489309_1_plen_43_part_00